MTRDEIVVFEVIAKNAQRKFWRGYKRELEKRFRQKEIVIRVMDCDTL